jgi:hypothetical protein
MTLYLVLVSIVLLIGNFLLVKRSKRKKKYGKYPGFVSLGMVLILLIMVLILELSLHKAIMPSVIVPRGKVYSQVDYARKTMEYNQTQAYNTGQEKAFEPAFVFLILALRIQLCIALLFAFSAFYQVSGRNKFYYLIVTLNALGIGLTFLLSEIFY